MRKSKGCEIIGNQGKGSRPRRWRMCASSLKRRRNFEASISFEASNFYRSTETSFYRRSFSYVLLPAPVRPPFEACPRAARCPQIPLRLWPLTYEGMRTASRAVHKLNDLCQRYREHTHTHTHIAICLKVSSDRWTTQRHVWVITVLVFPIFVPKWLLQRILSA